LAAKYVYAIAQRGVYTDGMKTRVRVNWGWGLAAGALVLLTVAWVVYAVQKDDLAAGQSVHSIVVDQRERAYQTYVPKSLPGGKVPLVVMLHGALGSGQQAEKAYGWNELADKYGFIVAYPDGLNRAWAVSDRCCGPPARDNVNDVAFITSMISDIQKKAAIDMGRIYVAGMSNGGALAYRLACDTDIFAAVGVVSATLFGECPNPHKVSVMHIHGKEDNIFPYGGGLGSVGENRDGWLADLAEARIPSIPDLMSMWRKVNNCAPSTVAITGVIRKAVATCAEDRDVVFIVIDGAGHQWPGSKASEEAGKLLGFDSPSTDLNATETLWNFFAKHRTVSRTAKE